MALRAHPSPDFGVGGRTDLRNDHHWGAAKGLATTLSAGHGAPASTQRLNVFTSWAESAFAGGIASFPTRRTASISRLASGFPGIRPAPRVPPFSKPSREETSRPDVFTAELWHCAQLP